MTMEKTNNRQSPKHKPGPYFYCRDKDGVDDCWFICEAGDELPFASIPFWDTEDGSKGRELEATARLLAAAPQMLETLKLIETRMVKCNVDSGDIQLRWLVRAAVAKAEAECIPKTAATELEPTEDELEFECFILPRRIEKALADIHDYLWEAEEADYHATPGSERSGHICRALATLRAWRAWPQGRLMPPR
jgi:hypothetical protein